MENIEQTLYSIDNQISQPYILFLYKNYIDKLLPKILRVMFGC
jgi:hypothetical protein